MSGSLVQRLSSMAKHFVRRSHLGRRNWMFKRMPIQNLPLAFTHRRYLFLVCCTVLFFLCLATTVRKVGHQDFNHHHHHLRPHHELKSINRRSVKDDGVKPHGLSLETTDSTTINKTLGFQEIFVLNLPVRTDKRDAFTLSAAISNITISFRDGIDGNDMVDKAIPPTFFNHYYSRELSSRGMIGSWRGHVNVLREIVERGMGSALILEDDLDWDVNIKSQLSQFASGSRSLLGSLDHENSEMGNGYGHRSSYGDESKWDILWLGHCGGWAPSVPRRKYSQIIHSDPTVPPAPEMVDLTDGVERDPDGPCSAHAGRDPRNKVCDSPRLKNDERIIEFGGSPKCSFAYAVTQIGARKLLYHIGGSNLERVDGNFDTELTEACRGNKDFFQPTEPSSSSEGEGSGDRAQVEIGGEGQFRCLSVSPPYFVHHRPSGSVTRDSDLDGEKRKKDVIREKGSTKGIRWSTRLNARRLIEGKEALSQYE